MRHRRMGSHELNVESSRSHSIMTVYCDGAPGGGGSDDSSGDYAAALATMGKISFVDLVWVSLLCMAPACAA